MSLAARAQELSKREAELAAREKALVKQETRDDSVERTFGDGLRRLEKKGLRAPPSND